MKKKIFLNRMMEFQVKFCLHSGLRLWRTDMLLSTKSKCHKSKFRISWMYTYSLYDLKVHFWCPNKCLVSLRSSWNTLYLKLHSKMDRCGKAGSRFRGIICPLPSGLIRVNWFTNFRGRSFFASMPKSGSFKNYHMLSFIFIL